jgi:hypothetical protein
MKPVSFISKFELDSIYCKLYLEYGVMTENDEHPIKPDRSGKITRLARRTEHELNPIKRQTSRELGLLNEALRGQINMEELPATLQVTVGEKEYTSVRRLEAGQLTERELPNENPYHHIIEQAVDAKLIKDGQIGVFLFPSTFGVLPVSEEAKEFLEKQGDVEDHNAWTTLLPMALDRGMDFKRADWSFANSGEKMLVKNVKGKYFINLGNFSRAATPQGWPIEMVVEVKPDEEGKITLWHQSYMWNNKQIDAQREMNEKLGRMYILQEGSSDKEQEEEPVGSTQQITSVSMN